MYGRGASRRVQSINDSRVAAAKRRTDELCPEQFGGGIFHEEGTVWREQRRFVMHAIRDFGLLEERVLEVGQDLISALEKANGQLFDPLNMLANASCNVVLYLTIDKHFPENDPDFMMIKTNVEKLVGSETGLNIYVLGRLSKYLPKSWTPFYPTVMKMKKDLKEFIEKIVKEHEINLEEDNPRDYVDAFLVERNKHVRLGKEVNSHFTEERLLANLVHLLVGGTETTANALYWALRILCGRPDVQERLHKELDEVVGRERLPSIQDRAKLSYTDAVILEVLRVSSIFGTSLPHTNPGSAKLKGYNIPARSVILPNLWAVHHDPKLWSEPDKFDPDRFMDPKTKTERIRKVIPFGIGKRSCLGESLARMELFLFLTMVLQKFTFRMQAGDTHMVEEPMAVIRKLKPYKLYAYPRE